MLYRIIWITAILNILFTTIAMSQITNGNPVLPDTINEKVIYEYDTVYLAPDTIRVTDTIVNYTKPPVAHKKSRLRIFNFFSSYSIFSNFTPNSFELKVSPFISGNFNNKELIDSCENKTGVNFSYSIQMNYNIRRYMFSVGIGFSPFHEKYYFNRSSYSSTYQSGSFEPYDSLMYSRSNTYENYYNLVNFYLSFGRSWDIGKKVFFKINISGHTDVLIGYNAYFIGNTIKLPSSSARNLDFSVNISPYLGYKISENLGIFISPFYQRSFSESKKYPRNTFQKTGIGAGLNIIL